jgi:indole-3-glycerol phosphate synthase
MDFLSQIIEIKKTRLAEARRHISRDEMRMRALPMRAKSRPHSLMAALSDDSRVNIIGEIKRASPSKGVIRAEIEPAALARAYEAGGAAAISVLTEENHFRGSLDDLRAARAAVSLPVLRKDFIFDEHQVYESAAAGADALLLIVAALDDQALARLRRISEEELGMDALVEVHTQVELERARASGARLIGVNNRDLRTFSVSLETSVELAHAATPDVVMISESGFRSRSDLRRLRTLGYKGFLIGEALMAANDPEATLRSWISK